MKNNKQGFTLIELLVVIAIIGLLSTLSIVALNSARARSRDARRVSDIKQIQTALEMYYNIEDRYPATMTSGGSIATGTYKFMTIVPSAPTPPDNPGGAATPCDTTTNAYKYTVGTNSVTYTLTYCLGGETGGIPAGIATATPAGVR